MFPNAEAMAAPEFKRWTLPNAEIIIARVELGPRAGECVFATDTVERCPDFYEQVKDLPYEPDAAVGWYEGYAYSPAGLVAVMPFRMMPQFPA